MKKSKPLSLHRETLSHLETLDHAAGGATGGGQSCRCSSPICDTATGVGCFSATYRCVS